jgi:hypothetical protein
MNIYIEFFSILHNLFYFKSYNLIKGVTKLERMEHLDYLTLFLHFLYAL